MPNREQRLQVAIENLAKYYGIGGLEEFAERLALSEIEGIQQGTQPSLIISPPQVLKELIKLFISTSGGSYMTQDLCNQILQILEGTENEIKEKYAKSFYVLSDSESSKNLRNSTMPTLTANASTFKLNPEVLKNATISGILGSYSQEVNQNPNEPNKEKPALSIILSNSKFVAQTQKYSDACSIFLNGIPNVEIARTLPYLKVEFLSPRPPINEIHKKLQSPSLLQFIIGNKKIDDNSIEQTLANANTINLPTSLGRETISENYSVMGMEVFTSPQTLVNANETNGNRVNQVLDKFRPFMTLKEFEVNLLGTTGLMNFKSGKLSFVLHDRSRLSEIAEYIQPDLYGLNEIMVEYGWIHPDGERGDQKNSYGDLINGMRIIEKYQIINSSYSFMENGEVSLGLSIAMKGGIDVTTEIIASSERSTLKALQDVDELRRIIGEINARVSANQGPRVREIRGIQVLNNVIDTSSIGVLSPDVRKEMKTLRLSLRNSTSGDFRTLIEKLDELLVGNEAQSQGRGVTLSGGRLGDLRSSILEEVSRRVQSLIESVSNKDPFVIPNFPPNIPQHVSNRRQQSSDGRLLDDRGLTEEERNARNIFNTVYNVGVIGGKISLASLLLHFIGVPLANTHKFDDVQFVYYTFNSYAGYMANKNIASFEVDLHYFAQELARYRLNNISRTTNMNLREFMSFVAETLLDDPAARSYGLWDNGALFKTITDTDNGLSRQTSAIDEAPRYQQRLENALRNITPDGSFKMPNIECYVECLPAKAPSDSRNPLNSFDNKSILKIHVFDKVSSAYEGLQSLLASARNEELNAVGRIAAMNPGGFESQEVLTSYIEEAKAQQLIEVIPNTNPEMYRVIGGYKKLKEFLYTTAPYIIYGTGGTLVQTANLSSMQDQRLSTVNLVRSLQTTEIPPNGESPNGLPLRIIPAELSMTTFGCPLLSYTQQFFIDFQTGTTSDNFYGITGLTHRISEDGFITDIKFTPMDGFGKYESVFNTIDKAREVLRDASNRTLSNEDNQQPTSPRQRNTNTNRRNSGPTG